MECLRRSSGGLREVVGDVAVEVEDFVEEFEMGDGGGVLGGGEEGVATPFEIVG